MADNFHTLRLSRGQLAPTGISIKAAGGSGKIGNHGKTANKAISLQDWNPVGESIGIAVVKTKNNRLFRDCKLSKLAKYRSSKVMDWYPCCLSHATCC